MRACSQATFLRRCNFRLELKKKNWKTYRLTDWQIQTDWLPLYISEILFYAILGLNFTWLCGEELPLDLNVSDKAGCGYSADDKESVGHELRVNNSLMSENTSYFITVLVTKDERQAVYTQEVFIVPDDPPEVQIRYVKRKQPGRHLKFTCAFNFPCDQNMLE